MHTDPQAAADEELVRACVSGDRGAFDMLVVRHQRQVYRLCYRFVGNHDDASELAQDAFVRAYRALPKFERTAKFTTWLYRIATNVCLDRVGRTTPRHEALDPDMGSGDERADDRIAREQRAARVRAAIARLPEKQRMILILRAYHDLPHEEVAKIVGGSVGSSKTNFFHALANLRKLLENE
ncbi:MAG TPA: sigma-70 family RNA polymerase sigma factor [Vicinamibacterales bacterium]